MGRILTMRSSMVLRRRDGDASAARVVVSGAPATAVTACGFSGVVMMLLCDMVFVCLVCVGNVVVCLFFCQSQNPGRVPLRISGVGDSCHSSILSSMASLRPRRYPRCSACSISRVCSASFFSRSMATASAMRSMSDDESGVACGVAPVVFSVSMGVSLLCCLFLVLSLLTLQSYGGVEGV